MWRATIKGLIAHKLRLALTALAVVLGVAFVAGTYILTDTIDSAFDGLFANINQGTAVQVQGVPNFESTGPEGTSGTAQRVPGSLIPTIAAVDGVRVAQGSISGYAQLVDAHGKAIATAGGAPTIGTNWITDPEIRSLRLLPGGRPPQGPDQVVVDAGTAKKHDLGIGDHVTVLLQGPPLKATVVGIVTIGTSDNLLGATLVAFDNDTAQRAFNADGTWDLVAVGAEPGVQPLELRDRIQKVLPKGYVAKTGSQAAADASAQIKEGLSFLNIALLVFAAIALFVGAFIIFNTFQILVTQRTRELALLRALGASPAQVRRSVVAEAAIVGTLASLVGLAAGFGIAIGLQAAMKAVGIDLPTGSTRLLPRTVIAALLVGVVTTVVSSVVPAIRASRVPPIAALRGAEPTSARVSRGRVITGLVLTGLAVLMLLQGLLSKGGVGLVGVGALLVFFGMAVLAPALARPISRFVGAPLPRFRGVTGKLARENAIRNPKRTASTAAALMIGLGLVAFVSIFAASLKSSTTRVLEENLKADYIITSTTFTGFSQDVAGHLRSSPAFLSVEQLRSGVAGLKGRATSLLAVDPANLNSVVNVEFQSGGLDRFTDDAILVHKDTARLNKWKVGSVVELEFNRTGTQRFRVAGIYNDNALLGNYLITLGAYGRNFTEQLDTIVLARSNPAAKPTVVRSTIKQIGRQFPNVQIQDQAEFRKSYAAQVDRLLSLFIVLLALAIIIAVVGIINTLALSVIERTRELGLLRAVGMARKQVRTMVRWEAVLISVFGAILGMGIGIFFGWALVQALHDQGVRVLTIPVTRLVVYVILAGLAGVVAAIFPARRAARLNVLEAIQTE